MNRLLKILLFVTWIVVIGVLIIVALQLAQKDTITNQQTMYVHKGLGMSAYDVAVKNGFSGDEVAWLASLKGKDSQSQHTIVEKEIETQTQTQTQVIKQQPIKGDDGKSAYDIWVSLGNSGTTQDFITSLKGKNGINGNVLSLRLNESTGKIEIKSTTDTIWKSIPSCGGTTGRDC